MISKLLSVLPLKCPPLLSDSYAIKVHHVPTSTSGLPSFLGELRIKYISQGEMQHACCDSMANA
jgi:hypothetical protein